MKKTRWFLICSTLVFIMLITACLPAYALTAEDAEQQIAAQGKEAVAGNVLIWFLCAIAFLKVSQKIDSFMSSLGINVGKTGGSMLAEAMIVSRSIPKGIGGFAGSGGFRNSRNTAQESPLSGGLTGMVGRMFTDNAAGNVTGQKDNMSSHMARAVYEESLKNGGDFAKNVISKVATGSISQNGTMKGSEASEAFCSYLGIKQTDSQMQLSNGDTQSSLIPVQPQGDTENMQIQEADIPLDSSSFDNDNSLFSNNQPMELEQDMNFSQAGCADADSDCIPLAQAIESESALSLGNNSEYMQQADEHIMSSESINNTAVNSMNMTSDNQAAENVSASSTYSGTSNSQNHITGNTEVGEKIENERNGANLTEQSNWLPDSPIVSGSTTSIDTGEIGTNIPEDFNVERQSTSCGTESSTSAPSGDISDNFEEGMSIPTASTNISSETQESIQPTSAIQGNVAQNAKPSFSDIEIGGGRITGTEVSQNNPQGIRFAMYNTDQYARPEDPFNIVKAVDGSKWYHQYAKNVVIKEPHMWLDGKIIYSENLAKKLPPSPKRKDRM